MRSITKASIAALAAVTATTSFAFADGLSGDLKIFLDTSNPAPRETFETMIAEFQGMHPDLKIETTIIDREAYKTQIRNFLTANAPDVATWYAGNRMLPYVQPGLFEDVSDLWEGELGENLASTKAAMTIDGKQWGVPYSYYQWGVYYRADIYNELGLTEPKTFEEMKSNCQAVLDSGRKCYTIGTKFLWTAAGWFDYLNMRTNGYEFHMDLTAGRVAWTDDRVKQTFANWRELIDMGAFIDNHTAYSWQEAIPFMAKGEAAAYLMGNFAVDAIKDAGVTDDQLDFYQFPMIVEGVPMAEEAPTDTLHIPSNAKNKANAKAFLQYVASADVQTEINAKLGQLPVNNKSSVNADDKFVSQGFEMLNGAYALAQFFDRDAPAEMAKVGMEGFQEFMVRPDNLDAILTRLDAAAKRIYK
ncbi:sugar ABC transporter substrate-binding protein [Amylibacter kogurei]|uniref:Sugar ABC transporter substrate-binding protein n=1 Tax=Paramylibacter kogurei TaxID=1889778 RepID=A0A2G5K905_9RHOB|nr:ABC transporter substrate-binding protein [Amylibacter kogurei]PIB26018.1 sugar ABC transporter substrate-binding protein [Amylibacter kogurei]